MTWSVVAREEKTGAFGVIVSTKAFAVGSLCPFAKSGVGALATQALVNVTYGPRGLRLLGEGVAAEDVVRLLIGADAGQRTRQLHVLDAQGRNAAHTGSDCVAWCGHLVADKVSVAGNMLAGPKVIEDTAAAYQRGAGNPFPERLMAAMDAGQEAGGDKRGRQSAALIVYTSEDYADIDLRVDDHADPLIELRRLYGVFNGRAQAFKRCLATRANPTGIFDREEIEEIIARAAATAS
ncbi:MAG: DUF1028 domain-containing protein [Proteobacteria bacterium]|nr:DUF1028 domain-containing protein [Pseudomonadota bacterium]MBI3495726.1 DUF1028 domain-containing protein [Pseudomonadota bacterium]